MGRLVIDLPRVISEPIGSEYDVVLRNGDDLIVPRYQQEVTVIGEVQSVTSHLYRADLTRDDYIALSGGMTIHADKSKIYVVRANGSVVANTGGFFRINSECREDPPGRHHRRAAGYRASAAVADVAGDYADPVQHRGFGRRGAFVVAIGQGLGQDVGNTRRSAGRQFRCV